MARETELKRVITVSLSPDVIDKLDKIARRQDRSRSFVVDAMLRRGAIDDARQRYLETHPEGQRKRNGKAARTAKANNA